MARARRTVEEVATSPERPALQRWIVSSIERFLQVEAASGILLLIATAAALVWASSPWRAIYVSLWAHVVATQTVHFWINDGLMTLFFFVVGLEIRREIHAGSLSRLRQAMLPVFAALGGMIVPGLIYLGFAHAVAPRGWAVPIATDIAFAVGVLGVLGRRVPDALRVLLLALAIVDDIGAIVVIAIFYSGELHGSGLLVAGGVMACVLAMQRFGVRSPWAYVPFALAVWLGIAGSGVHPTLAGVALGLATPVRVYEGENHSPVDQLIERFHPWVSYGLMPLFAFANAGIDLTGVALAGDGAPIALGIVLGLAIGKPLGIVFVAQAARKLGLAEGNEEITTSGLLLVGLVGGIGFTMAIFVAELAFPGSEQLPVAKAAVVAGSTIAALAGVIFGRLQSVRGAPQG